MMRHFLFILFLMTAPIAGFANEVFNLAPEYAEGQHFSYVGEFEIKVDSKTMPPNDMEMQMTWNTRGDFDVFVSKIADDGSTDLKISVADPKLRLSVKGVLQGGITFGMEFDSESMEEMPHEIFQIVQDVVKSFDQGEFIVVLDHEGRIVNAKGYESILEKTNLPTSVDPEVITKALSTMTTYLPGHPVQVGESWVGTHELMPDYKENWSLKSVNEDTLIVQNESSLSKEIMEGLILEPTVKIEDVAGSMTETIVLDRSTRSLVSVSEDAEISMKQIITQPQEMESDIQVEVKFKFEKKVI